jgi:hypothetical protein
MDDARTEHRTTAGRRFPADPPRVDEIIAVMKAASRPTGFGCGH